MAFEPDDYYTSSPSIAKRVAKDKAENPQNYSQKTADAYKQGLDTLSRLGAGTPYKHSIYHKA